jgi:outer membrane protein TolC
LPSDLLCRRPDVRRVEAQLASAAFDVRSLRASLLPSFSLQGDIGFGAQHLAALSNPASLFFLASANLLQSVFDAGRKESQIEMAVAKHLELLHQYSNTLLSALRDVEDALAGARLVGDQHRALVDAVDGAKANYTLNRLSFDAGAVDYFALLDAEQRVVGAEDSSEAALYERLRVAVDLYRALGGGSRVAEDGSCGE